LAEFDRDTNRQILYCVQHLAEQAFLSHASEVDAHAPVSRRCWGCSRLDGMRR
jgi:hypothetical protein